MAGSRKNPPPPKPPAFYHDEDQEAWSRYTTGIAPLGKRKAPLPVSQQLLRKTENKNSSPASLSGCSASTLENAGDIRAVDPRELKKISKGKRPAEAMLDLHGMTQNEAHRALIRFIVNAATAGKRTLKIVTGKSEHKSGGGVLRRRVPEWLAGSPELRPLISGLSPELVRLGGTSAAYIVTLRR